MVITKDDIIRMAREAGIPETATEGVFIANSDDLGRLIAAEREACAEICQAESEYAETWGTWGQVMTADKCATAIRKRGQE
jgi:hypothetical protein